MKSIFANILLLSSIVVSSNALVTRQDVCATVCRPVKPVCKPGQQATGVEGCWGCCVDIVPAALTPDDPPTVCTAVCREEKPVCPEGEAPTGQEGCWGCCVAV